MPIFSPAHNEPAAEGTAEKETLVPETNSEDFGAEIESTPEEGDGVVPRGEPENGVVPETVPDENAEVLFVPVKFDCPYVLDDPLAGVAPPELEAVLVPEALTKFEGELLEDKAGDAPC